MDEVENCIERRIKPDVVEKTAVLTACVATHPSLYIRRFDFYRYAADNRLLHKLGASYTYLHARHYHLSRNRGEWSASGLARVAKRALPMKQIRCCFVARDAIDG